MRLRVQLETRDLGIKLVHDACSKAEFLLAYPQLCHSHVKLAELECVLFQRFVDVRRSSGMDCRHEPARRR
ncbi:MAG: hypothetical protein R2729_03925 [Bryobacteraceae bacterium]